MLYGVPLSLKYEYRFDKRWRDPVRLDYHDAAVAFMRRFRGVIVVVRSQGYYADVKPKLCKARIPWVDPAEASPETRAIKAAANLAEGIKRARLNRQLHWSLRSGGEPLGL